MRLASHNRLSAPAAEAEAIVEIRDRLSRSDRRHPASRCGARGNSDPVGETPLQLGLDRPKQPEARLPVIARERDHETDLPMARSVGIAGERADPLHRAGLVQTAVMAVQQAGIGREEIEHFGEAARGEMVVATDPRALLEMDRRGEAVRGKHSVRDLERLLEADWPAELAPADLQEDLVGDVVVRGAEQL